MARRSTLRTCRRSRWEPDQSMVQMLLVLSRRDGVDGGMALWVVVLVVALLAPALLPLLPLPFP
ncbi:hypothetical protein PC116_g32305 [Phytophthora cactorum]|nr:hypothetical protein PC116_g32305 [Phytophthora cactorum]